jgi:hypothetical protein
VAAARSANRARRGQGAAAAAGRAETLAQVAGDPPGAAGAGHAHSRTQTHTHTHRSGARLFRKHGTGRARVAPGQGLTNRSWRC